MVSRPCVVGIYIGVYLPVTWAIVGAHWELLIIVLGIHVHGQAHLFQIREAGNRPGLLPRLGENREQNSSKYRDNRDNDEKLDKRKGFFHCDSSPCRD